MQSLAMIQQWLEELGTHRRVALDTNVVIYFLGGIPPYHELALHLHQLLGRGLLLGVVSTIVEAEVLTKPIRDQDQGAVDQAEIFFRATPNLVVRSVDSAVARRAAMVRARTQLLLPDAIIAATALEERCDAIIGNDRRMASQLREIPYVSLDDYVG